jgi:hypothetical protein
MTSHVLVLVDAEAIARVMARMHYEGVIAHTRFAHVQGLSFQALVNCPELVAVTEVEIKNTRAAELKLRLLLPFCTSPLDSTWRVTSTGVAQVDLRARLERPSSKPGVSTDDGQVVVDWTATQMADIQLLSEHGAEAEALRSAFLSFIHTFGGGTYTVTGQDSDVGEHLRILPLENGEGLMAVLSREGDEADVQPVDAACMPAYGQWSCVVPSETVVTQVVPSIVRHVRREVRRTVAPALSLSPEAAAPVVLASMSGPEADLRDLQVTLREGHLEVTATVGVPGVEDNIRTAYVRDGTESAVAPDQAAGGDQLDDVLGRRIHDVAADVLQKASLRLAAVPLLRGIEGGGHASAPPRVESRPSGLTYRGDVAPAAAAPPHASFSAFPHPASPSVTLNAGSSWAPAGRLTSYRWDFGDGSSVAFADQELSFMALHQYAAAGGYTVQLTVTDHRGGYATSSLDVHVGELALRSTPVGLGEGLRPLARGVMEGYVFAGATPVPGARVRASLGGSRVEAISDQAGRVVLRMPFEKERDDVEEARVAAASGGSRSHVTVEMPGLSPTELEVDWY